MLDDTTGNDGASSEDGFIPIERHGSIEIDPFDFGKPGSPTADSGNNASVNGGTSDAGSASDTRNSGGPYGHGYFPDGRPRKRRAKTESEPGIAQVSTPKPKRGKSLPLDPNAIEIYLYGIHHAVSSFAEASIPKEHRVIPLEHDDSLKLAQAICNTARHFPALEASQKYIDITSLIMCAGAIYGPMIYLYMENQKKLRRGEFDR